jgi:hypothetical protein
MRSLQSLALSGLLLASTATSVFAYDTAISTQVSTPSSERVYDDGGSYARPAVPDVERTNDDGGSYTAPTTPAQPGELERWA